MQSNILKPQNEFSLFFVFDINKNELEVLSSLSHLETKRAEIVKKYNSDITATISFGYNIWEDWMSSKLSFATPSGFQPFKKLVSPNLSTESGKKKFHYAPATNGDVFIHVNSERMDLNYQLVSALLFKHKQDIKVLVDISGYKYLGGRDLTGFIDGTKNPDTLKEKTETAIIQSSDLQAASKEVKHVMENGSFVLVQKWVHNLEKWETVNETDQEKVIGRKKPDSKPVVPRPETSHVARSILMENGKQYKILRASFPYGNKTGNVAGLLFCSYCKDLSVIDKMLRKMYGLRDQNVKGTVLYDRTLDYSQAVTGSYFFTPSLNVLEEIGRRALSESGISSKL